MHPSLLFYLDFIFYFIINFTRQFYYSSGCHLTGYQGWIYWGGGGGGGGGGAGGCAIFHDKAKQLLGTK
jgi:hypothetical protein